MTFQVKATLLLLFTVLWMHPRAAEAHATSMEVKVISIKSTGDEHLLALEPQNLPHLPKRIFVHLRFSPKKAAMGSSRKREGFDDALESLRRAVGSEKPVQIGLMSNKGFNPIKGRPGHYRSEMIEKVNWFPSTPDVVCFFHSDRYETAPE